MDTRSTKTIEKERWARFVNFERTITKGRKNLPVPVLQGGGNVLDVLPGTYRPSKIFRFSDLPALVPRYTEIQGVQWIPNNETDSAYPSAVVCPLRFSLK